MQKIFHKKPKLDYYKYLNYLLTNELPILSKSDLYVPVLSHLSSKAYINFPDEFSYKEIGLLNEHIVTVLQNMSLTSFLTLMREERTPENETPKYSDMNKLRFKLSKGDKTKMKRIEQEYVAQNILIPKFNKIRGNLPIIEQLYIVEKVNSLPRSKKYNSAVEHMLEHLPAFYSFVEVMTVTGYDINRKDKWQDFYDRQILILSLSYSDIFVSSEKWMRTLLTTHTDIVKKRNILYMDNLLTFYNYLCTL